MNNEDGTFRGCKLFPTAKFMKASIISLLTALGLSILIAPPAKSEMIFIESSQDGKEKYYLNTNSITFDRNFVEALVKIKYENPSSRGASTDIVRWKVNCSYRSLRVIESASYGLNGNFLSSSRKPSAWSAVRLGSIGDAIYTSMCNRLER